MKPKMPTETRNVRSTPFPTSRPSARTSDLKRAIVSGVSARVRNVAATQTTVVTAIVQRSFCQKRSGVSETCGQTSWKKMAHKTDDEDFADFGSTRAWVDEHVVDECCEDFEKEARDDC